MYVVQNKYFIYLYELFKQTKSAQSTISKCLDLSSPEQNWT